MKKSSLLPLAVIVSTFLLVPIAFWFLTSGRGDENIRGARTGTGSAGMVVQVSSKNGTWDMVKYLCKTRDDCLQSLVSGKALDTTSGGGVDNQFVNIRYTNEWDSYEFLKVFMKPGWGSSVREFNVSLLVDTPGAFIENFIYNGAEYEAVIVPTKSIGDTLVEVAKFSDL